MDMRPLSKSALGPLAVSALCLSGTTALAQVDTGAVSGVVTDASGSVVPGARIRIMHEETNFQSEIETNESGFYSAPGLRVGRYVVLITKEAFRSRSPARTVRPSPS